VNGKPAIAITDYTDFYPTLWFVLLHELYHVLFDWEEILINTFHVSGDDEFYTQNERQANDFAMKYFVSDSDLLLISENIRNNSFIYEFAAKNSVHHSFYYVFYAYQNSKVEPTIWGKIRRHMPDIAETLAPLVKVEWDTPKSLSDITKIRNKKVYNL
jgi:Zn-dependent peptidase ImmA (M78 family)